MGPSEEELTWREKIDALIIVGRYRPRFSAIIVALGGFVAFLEGIGLSFIYPIVQVAQSDAPIEANDAIMGGFLAVYRILGIPFQLKLLIIGTALVMIVRFISSFTVAWLRAILRRRYEEEIRSNAFDAAINASVRYFDEAGSDDILNTIITETRYSGNVIKNIVLAIQTFFLVSVYLAVMVYIAPGMTIFAILILGGITYLLRYIVEPAYTVGTRVAVANEQVQQAVQAGTQGIRDVKLFNLVDEVYDDFRRSIRQYTRSSVDLTRNEAALQNFYDLAAALTLFALIYFGFTYTGLSLGALGIFLFAMFRLSPLMSRLNSQFYKVEGNLSHLVRTQDFIERLRRRRENSGSRSITHINSVEFDEVGFSYGSEETVLREISFGIEQGVFVAFVGESGGGKSTIVSLLARMYLPDTGEIRANGISIHEFDLREWRKRIAVVRQQPFIFNESLEDNITIGNRDSSREDVERVCEIAKVDEFLDDLPNGYETLLGDDGVRLSGGQRQRVAIARALLKDADLLVLDEATSDLDSNLEREVQNEIESMEREYAIMAIAHRLSTVQNADRIHTVDGGRIVESGTHTELLNACGEYAQLYSIQSDG